MCCLFGLLDYSGYFTHREKNAILSVLSTECEVRGTDATGIAYNENGLHIYKRPVPAHLIRYRLPDEAAYIMGHTRLTTQGSQKKNHNNHPFRGKTQSGEFALAHNGVLHNDVRLRNELSLPPSKIETDSYIAVQLLEQSDALNFATLKAMAEQVQGSFTFTLLDEQNTLSIVKGDNPLCIYHFADRGFYLYASTEEILKATIQRLSLTKLRQDKVAVSCGDILQIDRKGRITKDSFDTEHLYASHRGYFMPYAYSFYECDCYPCDSEYVDLLKATASAYGYTPEEIDMLLADGFTPEEIEDFFYELE